MVGRADGQEGPRRAASAPRSASVTSVASALRSTRRSAARKRGSVTASARSASSRASSSSGCEDRRASPRHWPPSRTRPGLAPGRRPRPGAPGRPGRRRPARARQAVRGTYRRAQTRSDVTEHARSVPGRCARSIVAGTKPRYRADSDRHPSGAHIPGIVTPDARAPRRTTTTSSRAPRVLRAGWSRLDVVPGPPIGPARRASIPACPVSPDRADADPAIAAALLAAGDGSLASHLERGRTSGAPRCRRRPGRRHRARPAARAAPPRRRASTDRRDLADLRPVDGRASPSTNPLRTSWTSARSRTRTRSWRRSSSTSWSCGRTSC